MVGMRSLFGQVGQARDGGDRARPAPGPGNGMTPPGWPGDIRHSGDLTAGPDPAEDADDWPADDTGLRVPPFADRGSGHSVGEWPLQSFLELGALDGAVPSARLHTRHLLREWELAALADDAELVVSELVTNGVQASRAMAHAAIRLWLVSDQTQVVICVWDACPRPPVRMDAGEEAENGRGLLLVEAVSAQWGWFPAERAGDSRGKVVWSIVQK
jgi:anti-sigma regulatory factor (Ser/Thr protein kinase)